MEIAARAEKALVSLILNLGLLERMVYEGFDIELYGHVGKVEVGVVTCTNDPILLGHTDGG